MVVTSAEKAKQGSGDGGEGAMSVAFGSVAEEAVVNVLRDGRC